MSYNSSSAVLPTKISTPPHAQKRRSCCQMLTDSIKAVWRAVVWVFQSLFCCFRAKPLQDKKVTVKPTDDGKKSAPSLSVTTTQVGTTNSGAPRSPGLSPISLFVSSLRKQTGLRGELAVDWVFGSLSELYLKIRDSENVCEGGDFQEDLDLILDGQSVPLKVLLTDLKSISFISNVNIEKCSSTVSIRQGLERFVLHDSFAVALLFQGTLDKPEPIYAVFVRKYDQKICFYLLDPYEGDLKVFSNLKDFEKHPFRKATENNELCSLVEIYYQDKTSESYLGDPNVSHNFDPED